MPPRKANARYVRGQGGGGGRAESEHGRSARLVAMCYAEDLVDLDGLCAAWDMPRSTLGWAIVHEWLQRARRAMAELGETRGQLRMLLELALEDEELREWLRAEMASGESGKTARP